MESTERTPLLVNSVGQTGPDLELLKSPVEAETNFSFKSVSRRKKFILVAMGFVNFCAACCFSLLAPFFPIEAGRKGASQSIVGFIFGFFELVIVVTSPIFGNYISSIGCKFMFVSGVMVCGVCAILFGLLNMCPDGAVFIVMCFLCRGVEALGASGYVTALFAILAHEFPDNVITVMGMLETFSGLGMMVGPPIGGALYELGGYGLPFFVLGSVVIVCGLVTTAFMPDISGGESLYKGSILTLLKSPLAVVTLINIIACSIGLGFLEPTLSPQLQQGKKLYSGSILTLFRSPLVIVTFINLIAGSVALGFLDPTLANHLKQFSLKTWVVGLMFLIAPAVYAVTAPVWGYIGDKKGYVRLMIGGGSLGCVISMLLLGPVPLLKFIPTTLYMNVIALALLGLFVGCSLIPTFKALLIGANSLGMPNNLDTYGKVSGFFNSSFALGAFLGPTIGGAMVDKFHFPWASTGIAGIFVIAGVLMIVHGFMVPVLPVVTEVANQEIAIDTEANGVVIQNKDLKGQRDQGENV